MKVLSKKERHDLMSLVKKLQMGHEYLKSNIEDKEKLLHMLSLLETADKDLGKMIEKILD
jgi:hypothetical protein